MLKKRFPSLLLVLALVMSSIGIITPETTVDADSGSAVWNNNYETQATYELWTPSGTEDRGMLGKEVIFAAMGDNGKVYAMSASGDAITKTEITDMYFGNTLYIPKNYNLYNISWSTMWNKAESTATPDMGKGYLFQNMEDETYLGIWGVEVSSQGLPTGMTSNQIDYKRRFTWSSTLYANYKTTNFLHFDGTDFDADSTSGTNVLCYVKSYTGNHAVKNTWHQTDHFTTGRDYLLVTSDTPGTARAFNMTGTTNSSYDGKDVTIDSDGTITYIGAYNDSAVVNAHSLNDGTFYLNTWFAPAERQTLSYNGNGSDQSLYITSDNSLSTYAFRFEYSNGAFKVYYGSSGKGTVLPVRWRTRSGGQLGIGNGSSNTNEFFIFERDISPQDYTPAPTPTPRPVTTPDPSAKVVIACSDFQNPNGNTAGQAVVQNLINAIKRGGYNSLDGFMCCGDYDYEYSETEQGVTALRSVVEDNYGTDIDVAMVQGNHDQVPIGTAGMAPSGNNDTDNYGVYVINEDDYMWYNNNETTIRNTAANLKKYLDGKRKAKYTKPIFVLSHLFLHYSMRTYNDGDGTYAKYIFDVLNEAGEAGLNIIFMFGHDHSNGWDDYLGGGSIYLEKGDDILISDGTRTNYTTRELQFTYMNAGYTGYYDIRNTGADGTLTMTVFEITDDNVVVSRYDENGLHNLKAVGVSNEYKNETANGHYSPYTNTVASPKDIALNKNIIKPDEDPAATAGPSASPITGGTQRIYNRVTSVSDIKDGDQILMIYSGSKFMLPEKKELNSRIGFNLESTNISLDDSITGEYAAKEWTFTKSGSNWLIGSGGKNIKLTSTSGNGITATLESSGDTFTIGGSANAYTFTTGTGVLNYNGTRDLINGYASSPASFYLYRYSGRAADSTYQQVSSASGIKDGDKVLMIYNGSKFMLPESIEVNSRVGFNIEDVGTSMSTTITGNYISKEWTFTKSGDKWLLSSDAGYVKFTSTSNKAITATLESSGDAFTIGGSANAFTFGTDAGYYFNYNSRGLINGYAGNPASFYLYRYTDGSDIGNDPEEDDDDCGHPRSHIIDAVSPTDTEAGYTGDVVCTNCGKVLHEGGVLAPIGGPVVTVLGATLRLAEGDNSGKQSMRVGIRIDNADKARDCGIQISVGSKKYTVATKEVGEGIDVQQIRLHSKDLKNKSVVYAVILKDIPKSSFGTRIKVKGYAWGMDNTRYSTLTVDKNVFGVVDNMKTKFPALGITLGDDGILYKNSGAAVLEAADLNSYSNDPDPEGQGGQYVP